MGRDGKAKVVAERILSPEELYGKPASDQRGKGKK
jgi:hypothetical protein